MKYFIICANIKLLFDNSEVAPLKPENTKFNNR